MTRDNVAELVAHMSCYWRQDPDRQQSEALVDFGEGWLVPSRFVRRELLAAYDHWERETSPARKPEPLVCREGDF